MLMALTAALPVAARAQGVAPGAASARLSLNENPFGPSPSAIRAIAQEGARLSRYADAGDAARLQDAIAKREGVTSDRILLGDLLDRLGIYLSAKGGPGGRFVYSAPGYTALIDAAAPFGGIGVPVPLDRDLRNNLPALTAALSLGTRALFLVNPHNPSGTLGAGGKWNDFLVAASRRTLVIVDEAYLDYDDMERTAVKLTREGHNVAVFRTFDKIHGLAALPIGYVVAPAALAAELRQAGVGNVHTLSRMAVAAATAALSDPLWTATVRKRTLEGRDRLTEMLDKLDLPYSQSRANFVFFKSPNAPALREGLARAGIIVARSFPPLDDWIRITVGTSEEVTRTIAALKALVGR